MEYHQKSPAAFLQRRFLEGLGCVSQRAQRCYIKTFYIFNEEADSMSLYTLLLPNKGQIVMVKNDCFEHDIGRDNRCFKFVQNYDQNYRGRYHSEVILYNTTKLGATGYYGFAFRVPKNWEFSKSIGSGEQLMHNRVAISQFITSFKDWNCGRHKKLGVPGIMIWIQGNLRPRFMSFLSRLKHLHFLKMTNCIFACVLGRCARTMGQISESSCSALLTVENGRPFSSAAIGVRTKMDGSKCISIRSWSLTKITYEHGSM